jgi:hypothetical protein
VLGVFALAVAGLMYAYDSLEAWTVMSTVAFLLLFLGSNLLAMGLMGELLVQTGDHPSKSHPRPTITVLEVE